MKIIINKWFAVSLCLLIGLKMEAQLASRQSVINLGAIVQAKTIGFEGKYAIKNANGLSTVFDVDLVQQKHPSEKKIQNQNLVTNESGAPFVFGKLNSFYKLRLGAGLKKTVAKRVSKHTINVSVLGTAGLSLGMLKPVYLEVYNSTTQTFESERYDPERHSFPVIYGGSGFSSGLNETSFKPGMYGKVGVEFGWGNYKTSYSAIEIGVTMDAFFSDIPILHLAKNKSVFSGFYVSFAVAKIN